MSKINDSCYNNVKNIYTMSDIHGDLDLLIINLRDCAKVIKIDKDKDWRALAQLPLPNEHPNEILSDKSSYDCLFGFEWSGKDTYVVIIGDILDNYTKSVNLETVSDIGNSRKRQNEILHEELKIFLFLQKLNKNAQQKGGKVIIMIGDHEDMNIRSLDITKYISPYSLTNDFYDIKRIELFKTFNFLLNYIDMMKIINLINLLNVLY